MKKYIVLGAAAMFAQNAISQTLKEREKLRAYYAKTDKIPFTVPNNEYELAVKKAKQKNIPLTIINADGNESSLVRFEGETPIYYKTYNSGSAKTNRVTEVQAGGSMGLSLEGQEMSVGMWDGGAPRTTHQGFGNRVQVMDGSSSNVAFHPTHVIGTILSSGQGSSAGRGRGMAPQAWGQANDWGNDLSEMAAQAEGGLLLSNHSYGMDKDAVGNAVPFCGRYDTSSRNIDIVCFNYPKYIPVIAAGNDRGDYTKYNSSKGGNDLLTGASVGKNPIVVAAVREVANYIDPSSVVMSSFSNYGPTDDFRIKPDISAKGVNVYSTSNTSDGAYASSQGTSMAAPAVTGSLLLVQQFYGGLGIFDENEDPYMRAATLKGLMAHTADEAGPDPGPDQMFGWGLINVAKMIETLQDLSVSSFVIESNLANGQVFEKTVVANNVEDIKVTLCWTDRSGTAVTQTDSNSPRLVNDLDVRVIKEGGEIFYPWFLNKDWNALYADMGDNNVDTVERVDMEGTSGVYKVVVSHKGSLTGGSQDFSLIITGVDAAADLSVGKFDSIGLNVWADRQNGVLKCQFEQTVNAQIAVFDINGRAIKQVAVQGDFTEIPLQNVSKGVYILKVTGENGVSLSKKVVW